MGLDQRKYYEWSENWSWGPCLTAEEIEQLQERAIASNDIPLGKLLGEAALIRRFFLPFLDFIDPKLDEETKNHDMLRLARFFADARRQ